MNHLLVACFFLRRRLGLRFLTFQGLGHEQLATWSKVVYVPRPPLNPRERGSVLGPRKSIPPRLSWYLSPWQGSSESPPRNSPPQLQELAAAAGGPSSCLSRLPLGSVCLSGSQQGAPRRPEAWLGAGPTIQVKAWLTATALLLSLSFHFHGPPPPHLVSDPCSSLC